MRPAKQSIAITMGLFKNAIMFNYLICSPFCVTVPNHICADAITEEKYASVENVVISFNVELAHFSPWSSGGSRSINGHFTMLRDWNSLLMVIRTHQSQLRLLLLCFKPMRTRKIKQNFKSNICNVALPVHLQHVWLKPQTLSADVLINCVMECSSGAKICSLLFWNCFWNPTTGILLYLALWMSLKQRGLPEAWSSWVISTINDTINMAIWCYQRQHGK